MDEYTATGNVTISSDIATGISNGYVYVDNMAKLYPMPEPGDGITIKNERSGNMMGLYEVYVVNKKLNLHAKNAVIAKDDRIAERKIGFPEAWDLDNLVFFTRCIGEWKSEKPQKVKIVKD